MSEAVKKITANTLVPLSIVGGIVFTIITVTFFLGGFVSRVEALEKNDSPTRKEYDATIKSIDDKLKTITDTINNKSFRQ